MIRLFIMIVSMLSGIFTFTETRLAGQVSTTWGNPATSTRLLDPEALPLRCLASGR